MNPEPYGHLRPTADAREEGYEAGVYRVVGTEGGRVTLLRVGDSEGRRVTTGLVVTVPDEDLDGFEPAENPDGNRSPVATLASLPRTFYWSVVAFGQQLASRPAPAAAALALFLAGSFGDQFVTLPEPVSALLVLVGGIGLALVGSGRV